MLASDHSDARHLRSTYPLSLSFLCILLLFFIAKCDECELGSYYMPVSVDPGDDGDAFVFTFADVLALTPEGCVLAPVTSEADLAAIAADLAAFKAPAKNYYLGVYLPLSDYETNCIPFSSGCYGEASGWLNLDGTEFPEVTWAEGNAFTRERQVYGGINGARIPNDIGFAATYEFVEGGVFKCCLRLPEEVCPDDGKLYI